MVDVRPTPQQLAWQESELSMFLHFGMNTFTDREWGTGAEDPSQFNPAKLDARQWARVAREAGFRYVILTAKHHDGFCLWPSRYTAHSVRNSPWADGNGDVIREFVEACSEFGLKAGLYVSPWDRHEPSYGDSDAYNRFFVNQLTELLTNYGEIAEVWFDGACGEGPNGRRQSYDWQAFYEAVRALQPEALIAICGPDIRWVGNEDGYAAETEWSVRTPDPSIHGSGTDTVWWPAECDVSIRPGWFWHAAEDDKVKSLPQLVDIYLRSVGRNSVLLLNVPPNRDGLLPDPDVRRLRELRGYLDRAFARNLAEQAETTPSWGHAGDPTSALTGSDPQGWRAPTDSAEPVHIEFSFPSMVEFNTVVLRETIALGQFVERYHVEIQTAGGWREFSTGTTIGQKKIDTRARVACEKLRVVIEEARGPVRIQSVGIYDIPDLSDESVRGHEC